MIRQCSALHNAAVHSASFFPSFDPQHFLEDCEISGFS